MMRIVFLGDSLTDGYHLDRTKAYPALVLERIRARGGEARIINAGVSGDTTAQGLARLDPLLQERVDILFVALGVNDLFQGVPIPVVRAHLEEIIGRTRAAWPEMRLVIAGMDLGSAFWSPRMSVEVRGMYEALASTHDAVLVPSLLAGVVGEAGRTLPDGVHPTAEGQQVMARTVWAALGAVVEDVDSAGGDS
jgi:acyl-CoA thioesterase-1